MRLRIANHPSRQTHRWRESTLAGVVPHPVCRESDGLVCSGYASSGFKRDSIR